MENKSLTSESERNKTFEKIAKETIKPGVIEKILEVSRGIKIIKQNTNKKINNEQTKRKSQNLYELQVIENDI